MLIFVAAGETEAERDKVFLGRAESPMTDLGKEQITDAADTLSSYNLDHIYSSDLYRAQQTLHAIVTANHYDPLTTLVEELRERSGGSYEGKPFSEIRKGMSPKQYKAWERDPFEPPLHGESLVDVRDRVRPWWDEEVVPRLEKNERVLIISHPDTVRVLISMARGDDMGDAPSLAIEHGLPYFYYGHS